MLICHIYIGIHLKPVKLDFKCMIKTILTDYIQALRIYTNISNENVFLKLQLFQLNSIWDNSSVRKIP